MQTMDAAENVCMLNTVDIHIHNTHTYAYFIWHIHIDYITHMQTMDAAEYVCMLNTIGLLPAEANKLKQGNDVANMPGTIYCVCVAICLVLVCVCVLSCVCARACTYRQYAWY